MRGRLRYALLAALVLALGAVVAVAALAPGEHASTASSLARGQVLAASASVTPQSHLFGDAIHVRIEAVVDHRALDPDRIRVDAGWAPYSPVGSMQRTRTDIGAYSRLTWTVDLHCVVVDCVPRPGSKVPFQFVPTTIAYVGHTLRGPVPDAIRVTWPEVSGVSRLDPIDLERRAVVQRIGPGGQLRSVLPPWRVSSTTLAPVSYRISPGAVFWVSVALALLLVLASAALLRPYLPQLVLVRRRPPLSTLERALAAVERARAAGDLPQERKALELLAAELRRTGSGSLAWTASELAWSAPRPEPERTGALAADVRRQLEGRRNGHRA